MSTSTSSGEEEDLQGVIEAVSSASFNCLELIPARGSLRHRTAYDDKGCHHALLPQTPHYSLTTYDDGATEKLQLNVELPGEGQTSA